MSASRSDGLKRLRGKACRAVGEDPAQLIKALTNHYPLPMPGIRHPALPNNPATELTTQGIYVIL
ncbi:MAG TPA: hypothetical protein VE870_08990 [Bacteroidales bacterium]|nr:hypothetical protein [Bacteroidales bacterium]